MVLGLKDPVLRHYIHEPEKYSDLIPNSHEKVFSLDLTSFYTFEFIVLMDKVTVLSVTLT